MRHLLAILIAVAVGLPTLAWAEKPAKSVAVPTMVSDQATPQAGAKPAKTKKVKKSKKSKPKAADKI